jgi:hypothetical protein
MTRKTVNVNYGQVCFRVSQETVDRADALISRLAMLDGLQRSVARSDVLREAVRRGLVELEKTLPASGDTDLIKEILDEHGPLFEALAKR